MGIAGAGFGAAKALEQILADQMVQAQLKQRELQAAAQMEMERARLDESKRQADLDAGQRQQQIDMQAGDRRQRQNITGIRRMMGEAITQGEGPIASRDRRGLAALQIEAGDEPTMLNEPKPERDPIADHAAKAKIDAQYRKPERDPIADHEAKLRLEAKYKTGQGTGPSPYSQERATRTIQSVDELLGKVSRWTTGVGSMAASLPETGARNFKAELDTLKANIAFNELTAMREASKTGGALGAVSEKEMQLLQSALGALDQGQSPDNIAAQLGKIKESVQRWQAAAGGGTQTADESETFAEGTMEKPIPGMPGAIARSTDGGKTWTRVK